MLSVTVTAFAEGGPGSNPPGGASASSVSYSGATTINADETQSDQSYTSTAADENALLIDTDEAVTITNPAVTKTGDSQIARQNTTTQPY